MDSNSTSYSRPFTLAPASISINGLRPLAILRHRPYTLNTLNRTQDTDAPDALELGRL